MSFKGRSLIALWWHCLLRSHKTAWVRAGFHGPKMRFCWDCDRNKIEAEIGEILEDRP